MNARVSELRRLIDAADEVYYTHGKATVEDARYDSWKDELARFLDKKRRELGGRP